MNRTLRELRALLGAPARFQIDAEPDRRKRPVITTARWACGCRAEGPGLTTLLLAPCEGHAPPVPVRALRRMPRLGALLSRS